MAHNWVRLGHRVTIITEMPNHPSGIVHPAYRGKLIDISDLDGIRVIRVWVAASPIKSFKNRMLFYLSYMLNATLAGLLVALEHYDLIYATSPPLFVGGTALALHWLRRLPMFFEVRDLWPDAAVALGEIKHKRAIQLASALEFMCYQTAECIIVVTEGIHKRLVEKGIEQNKILLIPNGANVERFKFNQAARQQTRDQLGLERYFVVMYAGIHGIAQGLETILEAAWQLRDDPRFYFVLVGEGPEKAKLKAIALSKNISNLLLLDEQPREKISEFISAADVMLIPLKKIGIFNDALPSKIFDAWACERPILLSVDGEARKIVDTSRGGWFVPPEDPLAIVQKLDEIVNLSQEERLSMGRRGRLTTINYYSRRALAEKLIEHLIMVLEQSRSST
jgi:glycosyltransferase involved in cell wall biosynthesis